MAIKTHKKKEQGLVTKQRILLAAEHVFFERGAAMTTLEQIAEKANVTRGAIYGHFRNKDMLLEHMIDSAVSPVLDIVRTALSEAPEPGLEQLRQANINVILTIIRSPELIRRLSITLLKCEYTEEFSYIVERYTYYRNEVLGLFVAYFSDIQKRGTNLPKEPKKMANALLFYTAGMLTEFLKDPDISDLEENLADYFDIFFCPAMKTSKMSHKEFKL